jgi:PAS domain S-box-containing protein
MKWLKNLSINVKLLLAFITFAVIAAVIGIIGLNSLSTVSENSTLIYEKSVKPTSALINIATLFQRGRSISRDVMLINYPPEIEKEIDNLKSKLKLQEEAMNTYESLINTPEKRKGMDELKEIHFKYVAGLEDYYKLTRENQDLEAYAYLNGEFDNLVMSEIKAIDNLVKIEDEYSKNLADENKSVAATSNKTLLFLILIGVVLAIVLSYVFMKIIGGTVSWYEALLDSLKMPMSVTDMNMNWTFINKAVEDFLKLKRKDVIGKQCSDWGAAICKTENCGIERANKNKPITFFEQFGGYFKVDTTFILDKSGNKIGHVEFVQDLTDLKKQSDLIKKASYKILLVSERSSTTAGELKNSTGVAASSSEEISANANSVSTAAEEMASSIKEISNNTQNASKISKDAAFRSKEATEAMDRLSKSSAEVASIIKIINNIAEQTNLLALNATIEAARAGEAGKGFAVVASEVKTLAQESAKSTENITNNIKKSMDDTQVALEKIKLISEIIKEVNDISNTIASAIEEQTITIAEVNRNLSEVSKGSNMISDANHTISKAANDYSELAEEVKVTALELKALSDKLEADLTAK